MKAAGVAVRSPGGWGRREPAKPANEVSPDSGPIPAPGRSPSASACEPYFDFIDLSLSKGRNAKAIYQDLVDDHGFTGRLSKEADTTIRLPSEYLVDIYADSLTHDPAAVRYLVERLGEDQVVLGSDHPFDMGEADPVGKVKEAIDDPAIVDKILGGTASRLLNLA